MAFEKEFADGDLLVLAVVEELARAAGGARPLAEELARHELRPCAALAVRQRKRICKCAPRRVFPGGVELRWPPVLSGEPPLLGGDAA